MNALPDAPTNLAHLRRRIAELERQLGAGPPDPDLRSVLDGMFEGIQVIGFDWRYLYLNETAARHGQRSREELLGRTMIEAYPGIETTEVHGLLQRCMTERSPQQMVNRFAFPDGRTGWFDLRIEPVPMGILVLSIEVGAQMAAEEQLRRSREEERALTARLHQVLKPEVIDLNGVVERVDALLRRLIGEDIDLVTRLRARAGRVEIDPGQIEQVIMNLAVNARDAMPQGGQLTIETADVELDEEYARAQRDARPGPHVMLAITDSGTGMDAVTRARIFELYFTTKELGRGTGLGLSTVYGIVKQSGANIWVYSEPGFGTTFKVYLPRADKELAAPRPPSPEPVAAAGHETILLVEDDDGVRGFVRTVLAEAGYTVLEAEDARRALEVSARHGEPIHLLLTDVVMPRMGGRALAERMLALRPSVRVIYMSGYTDDAIVRHSVLDPGTEFIEKPLAPGALLARIRAVLAQR